MFAGMRLFPLVVLIASDAAAAVVDWTAAPNAPVVVSERTYVRVAIDGVWLAGTYYAPSPNSDTPQHWDTYIQRITASGATVFTMYFRDSFPAGLALDAEGNAVVAARTGEGRMSGFVAKVNPSGTTLWRIPIDAQPYAVALGPDSAVYIAGVAYEQFKATAGALKTTIGPPVCPSGRPTAPPVICPDAFVAKVRTDGSGFVYATLLGGAGQDRATSLAVDSAGAAYVVGFTASTDFPTTPNALQRTFQGGPIVGPLTYGDGFVAKLNSSGTALVYGTYLGGSEADEAIGIAIDREGRAAVTGATDSNNFPVSSNAWQRAISGSRSFPASSYDAFIIHLNERGERIWATYFGRGERELGREIAFGPDGRIYVNVDGNVRAILEQRASNGCDWPSGTVVVDAATGRPLDSFVSYGLFGTANADFDRSGSMYIGATRYAPHFGAAPFGTRALRVNFAKQHDIAPACIVNAATMRANEVNGVHAISPGEIITIMGERLGPETGIAASVDANGRLPKELGDTRVLVGEVEAALLYVSSRQLNAIVPYEVTSPAPIVVTRRGARSGTASIPIEIATPALFTNAADATQLAALNEDGSINSVGNPAARGSIVSLFGTGFGMVEPTPASDALTPLGAPYPTLKQHVEAYSRNGLDILYAGPAPGAAPGVSQFNVRLSDQAGRAPLKIVVYTRGSSFVQTQAGTSVYVR
jgi:uncharacterized protein (TIGR03437 family)